MLMDTCEDLAGVREQLEALKAGTQEHKRLLELSQVLYATLEAARPAHVDITSTDLSEDQLIARTTEILKHLLTAREMDRQPPLYNAGDHGQPQDGPAPAERGSLAAGANDVPTASSAVASAPEPARCPYCGQSPCVGPEHSAFDVLHWDDPEEVTRVPSVTRKK
jgi:hypothetical protein